MSASLRAGNSSDGYLQIDGADIVDITASGMAPSSGKTITANALSDNTVTTAKILNANVTPAKLSQPLTTMTAQASTSGTSIDFTSIPSWAKRITVMFYGVSKSGTSPIIVQLGDSGGVENTGYLGTTHSVTAAVGGINFTDGFCFYTTTAANTVHGQLIISHLGSNMWVATGIIGFSDKVEENIVGGSKTLSATLDRVRVTMQNGTDTFDAGTINVMYE